MIQLRPRGRAHRDLSTRPGESFRVLLGAAPARATARGVTRGLIRRRAPRWGGSAAFRGAGFGAAAFCGAALRALVFLTAFFAAARFAFLRAGAAFFALLPFLALVLDFDFFAFFAIIDSRRCDL